MLFHASEITPKKANLFKIMTSISGYRTLTALYNGPKTTYDLIKCKVPVVNQQLFLLNLVKKDTTQRPAMVELTEKGREITEALITFMDILEDL